MLRERVAPWVIWISAVVGTVLLWQGVDNGHLVTGFAETITVAVAPTETGRVSKVLAAQGAEVQRGQAVAVLDAGPIAHEIRALKAERARLEAELTKTRLEAQRDLLQVDRAAGEVAARSKRTLRDADAILAERRAALTAVDRELRALKALVDQRLLDRQAISRLTIERATLRKAVAEARASAALAETQANALSDAPGGGDAWVEAAGAPILKAMDAIDTQLLVAGTRREQLILRSPTDGQVSQIFARSGEFADPTRPVLAITGVNRGRVIACVPEAMMGGVAEGSIATLHAAGEEGYLHGVAVALGPVAELPTRCRTSPQLPMWGREVIIELDGNANLLPGRSFDILFEPAAETDTKDAHG